MSLVPRGLAETRRAEYCHSAWRFIVLSSNYFIRMASFFSIFVPESYKLQVVHGNPLSSSQLEAESAPSHGSVVS